LSVAGDDVQVIFGTIGADISGACFENTDAVSTISPDPVADDRSS